MQPTKYGYNHTSDLWVVTCYFNPCQYKSRLDNFLYFYDTMKRASLNMLILECVFDGAVSSLGGLDGVTTIYGSAQNLMWQKERLLNLAVERLPPNATKVAWLDCDILFDNKDWAVETSKLLDSFSIVQPFRQLARLAVGDRQYNDRGELRDSFAFVLSSDPESMVGNYFAHGHTGLGWAARREILENHGLYDVLLSGSGDHFIAHATNGSLDSQCFDFVKGTKLFTHYLNWAVPFFEEVNGSVAFVEGSALHLWHGGKEGRRYRTILRELLAHGFDPYEDIRIAENGLFEWNSEKPQLHDWAASYFSDRDEDSMNDSDEWNY